MELMINLMIERISIKRIMNRLSLICGNDIVFNEAKIIIHNPTMSEIGLIGEESFWSGYEILRFDKEKLTSKDKNHLEDSTNFDIIMSIIKDKKVDSQKVFVHLEKFFSILFPEYKMLIMKDCISLINLEEKDDVHYINNGNFPTFVSLLKEMFYVGEGEEEEYNPEGELAQKIADKLKKRRQKLAQGNSSDGFNILERYISILSIGLGISKTEYKKYTVYQIFDEYKRFKLREEYNILVKAQMMGAKDIELEDWCKDLYS